MDDLNVWGMVCTATGRKAFETGPHRTREEAIAACKAWRHYRHYGECSTSLGTADRNTHRAIRFHKGD